MLIAAGGGIWFYNARQKPTTATQAPGNYSGSAAVPPAEENLPDASGWMAYADKNSGFSFKYPQKFGANVWHPVQWPPAITVIAAGQDPIATGCPKLNENSTKQIGEPGATANGTKVTLNTGSDIGAGQLYSEYCYIFDNNKGSLAVIDFIIQSHTGCGFGGCGAYCGTEYEKECQNLDRKTEIGTTIMQIIETASFEAQK